MTAEKPARRSLTGNSTVKRKLLPLLPFGSIVMIWRYHNSAPVIRHILLSHPERTAEELAAACYPGATSATCLKIDRVAAGITAMLHGETVTFPLTLVELERCTDFQQRVLRAERAIPPGELSTYGLLARHLGCRGGARAVGNALANNPFPLLIPCHRAVRSDRSLGGFQGGKRFKRYLLENEGVDFDGSGKVRCSQFYYQN